MTYALNMPLAVGRSGVFAGAPGLGAFVPRGTVGAVMESYRRQTLESLGTLLTLELALAISDPLLACILAPAGFLATPASLLVRLCLAPGLVQCRWTVIAHLSACSREA